MDLNESNFRNATTNATSGGEEWTHGVFFKIRVAVLLLIVIMAVLGNMLVIVSVMRHRYLFYYIYLTYSILFPFFSLRDP